MSAVNQIKSACKAFLASALHRCGAFLLLRSLHRRAFGSGVRILFYHRIAEPDCPRDARGRHPITSREFERQLKHLTRFYRVISLEEAAKTLRAEGTLPKNAVVITFDDGYRDNYTLALPLLEKYRAPATVFLVTSAIDGTPFWFEEVTRWFAETALTTLCFGEPEREYSLAGPGGRAHAFDRAVAYLKLLPGARFAGALADLRNRLNIRGDAREPRQTLNWDEVRAMAASEQISIGAHTVSHPILPNLTPDEIAREIRESAESIARETGRRVQFFAYPNGDCDSFARHVVSDMNLVGCTTGGGGFNPIGSDVTRLARLGVDGLSFSRFVLSLSGWEDLSRPWRQRVNSCLRGAKRLAYAAMEYLGIFPLLRRSHPTRVRVLMYHGVRREKNESHIDGLHVPEKQFRKQMGWLRRKFTPITLDKAIAGLEGREPLPERPVVVTFDDAYRNVLDVAAPILSSLGIPAALFVSTNLLGSAAVSWSEELEARLRTTAAQSLKVPLPNGEWLWLRNREDRRRAYYSLVGVLKTLSLDVRVRALADLREQLPSESWNEAREAHLDWDDLKKLVSMGFSVGSHSSSHASLPALKEDDVASEIRESKASLEKRLNADVRAFAYPYGAWDRVARQEVERAGYACAFTAEAGFNDHQTDRFLLRRSGINDSMNLSQFRAAASGFARLGAPRPLKILQVSNYPPPHCGWAMQTKVLTDELRRRGAICEVLNISPDNRRIKSREYIDVQNGRDYLWKIVKYSLRGYRFQTHVNAESKKGYFLALSAHLMGRLVGRPAVMTFHGGLPQTYFPRTDSRFLRFAYQFLFDTAGTITCDDESMKNAIQSYGTNGKPVMPFACFSPEYLSFQPQPLPAEIQAFVDSHSPVFFCYVAFRPEYGLDEFRQAAEKFVQREPRAGFIWLGFNAKELPMATKYLSELPDGAPQHILAVGNLDHELFLSLLVKCFAYIRPHSRDGIAASVLESLALGIPVIATDDGRRPPGVVTYKFPDPEDMYAKFVYVLENYELVKKGTRLPEAETAVERTAQWLLETAAG